jgi:hypothetical protein
MKNRTQLIRFGLAATAGVVGLFAGGGNWSSSQNASLISQAEARIGRPLTPGSVAGVNRRVDRRTARRAYYGTGGYYGYGTGAAIGTAAALGAAGTYWGSQYYNSNYNNPYYANAYYGNPYYGSSYYGNWNSGWYPGRFFGAPPPNYGGYTGQYYGTYPGQYYGTYAAQSSRPMSNKNYEGPAYYGNYAYATMDQVRSQAESQATKAQASAPATPVRNSAWCASRFKSYNPATGTFLGKDGRRHACP